MLIFSWTDSTGNLEVKTTGALPTGLIINSCLIGGTTVNNNIVLNSADGIPVYSEGLDAHIAVINVIEHNVYNKRYFFFFWLNKCQKSLLLKK